MRELRLSAPLAILCASLAAAAAVWAGAGGPIRAALGIALVLVLPCAALLALLGLRLSVADTLLAVCACSIAVTILAGLALGAAHTGFGADRWAGALTGVAALLSAAALARALLRRRVCGGGMARARTRKRLAGSAPAAALCAAAAAIAVLALAIAHNSAAERISSGVNSVERGAHERPLLSRRAANAYLLRLGARTRAARRRQGAGR
jgi:uncharacterized membrane protein